MRGNPPGRPPRVAGGPDRIRRAGPLGAARALRRVARAPGAREDRAPRSPPLSAGVRSFGSWRSFRDRGTGVRIRLPESLCARFGSQIRDFRFPISRPSARNPWNPYEDRPQPSMKELLSSPRRCEFWPWVPRSSPSPSASVGLVPSRSESATRRLLTHAHPPSLRPREVPRPDDYEPSRRDDQDAPPSIQGQVLTTRPRQPDCGPKAPDSPARRSGQDRPAWLGTWSPLASSRPPVGGSTEAQKASHHANSIS